MTRYQLIFRAPGAKGFASAAFLARLPIAMAPIGIVAMLSQTHGAYWLAGAVAATFTLTNAIIAPQLSRRVDRLGQSRVVIPTTTLSVLAFVMLLVATRQQWPTWTLFAAALLAAVMPSIPAMVRARWTELFRDRPELATAFAFESVADELVYIAGASLAVGLSVAWFPEAGLLVSTLAMAIGTAAFIAQRASEPRPKAEASASRGQAIMLRPVQIIATALVFVGAIFATVEVSVIAVAEHLGQPSASTLIIGLYATGSFVVGLILGSMTLKTPLHRQFLLALTVIALTNIPPRFAGTLPLLALAIVASGAGISAAFISAFGLVERHAPPAMLTEAITWVMTGIGIGMALGAFVAGWVVDTFGAWNGFWMAMIWGGLALATVLAGRRTLDASRATPRPSATADHPECLA